MANFINKYLNQSAYDADSTKQYPNTSLVGNDIVFAMAAPAFGGLTVKYNIVDTTNEVTLFNGGGASSGSSESSSESGGGGALPTTMIVDGNEETPINTWRFETAGEHIVQYEFADNIIPGGFLNGSFPMATATEVIIGDNITEIVSSPDIGGAFQNTNITTATIGTGMTAIGDSAFAYSYLETLTVKADNPPILGSNVLTDSSITAIYVPASAVETYKSASGWSTYTSIIQPIV